MAINYNNKGNLKKIYYNNEPVYQINRQSDNKVLWCKPYILNGIPGEAEIETPDSIPRVTDLSKVTNRKMWSFSPVGGGVVGYTGCIFLLNEPAWKVWFTFWFVDSFAIEDTWEVRNSDYGHVHIVQDNPETGEYQYLFSCWGETPQGTYFNVILPNGFYKSSFVQDLGVKQDTLHTTSVTIRVEGIKDFENMDIVLHLGTSTDPNLDTINTLIVDASAGKVGGKAWTVAGGGLSIRGGVQVDVRNPKNAGFYMPVNFEPYQMRHRFYGGGVERRDTQEPTASTGSISVGDTVYYKDVLYSYATDEEWEVGKHDSNYVDYNNLSYDAYDFGVFTKTGSDGAVDKYTFSGQHPIVVGYHTFARYADSNNTIKSRDWFSDHELLDIHPLAKSNSSMSRQVYVYNDFSGISDQWLTKEVRFFCYFGSYYGEYSITNTNSNYTNFSAPVVNVKSTQDEDTAGAIVTWYSGSATNTNDIPVKMETLFTFYYKNGTTKTTSDVSIVDPGYKHTDTSGGDGNIVGLKIVSYAYAFGTNKMSSQSIGNTSGGGGEEDTEEETT